MAILIYQVGYNITCDIFVYDTVKSLFMVVSWN